MLCCCSSGGHNKQMQGLLTSDLAWAMTKISWFLTCTGNTNTLHQTKWVKVASAFSNRFRTLVCMRDRSVVQPKSNQMYLGFNFILLVSRVLWVEFLICTVVITDVHFQILKMLFLWVWFQQVHPAMGKWVHWLSESLGRVCLETTRSQCSE